MKEYAFIVKNKTTKHSLSWEGFKTDNPNTAKKLLCSRMILDGYDPFEWEIVQELERDIDPAQKDDNEKIEAATKGILKVLKKRNEQYGSLNLAREGTWGILVRLSDKMERLRMYSSAIGYEPSNEDFIELFTDIAGYGIMGAKLKIEGRI